MEKRVVLAIALSIAILLAFRYFEESRLGKQPKPQSQTSRQAPAAPVAPQPATVAPKPVQEQPPIAALPAEETVPARRIVVEGDLYRAVLDNRGGTLFSWQLKQFKTSKGEVYDMIPSEHMQERPYPTTLLFEDAALTKLANEENYAVEVVNGANDAKTVPVPATIVMRLRRGDVTIEKRFRFEKSNYLVDFSAAYQRGDQSLHPRVLLGQDIGSEQEHLLNPAQLQAIADLGGSVSRYSGPKDENEVRAIGGNVLWAGLDMQYFAEISIPAQPLQGFDIQRRPVRATNLEGQEVSRDLIRVTIPTVGTADFRMYLGPKLNTYLGAVPGVDLSGVINYGWLSFLIVPLLAALRFINVFSHNYGIAIILLTFVLTLALFPFRLKQMASMKKMQKVQPKIKEIQERYKRYKSTDPKKAEMNQEIMALYKEHNVNPLGGCLPLLLQMPLLFAFYRLLSTAIELRQAPFFGWLHDLVAKDPYYVLPIVMGLAMVISQKMTPMTPGTDPTQAKMMMIMPVVFTVMFLNVSSGLNLYFLCSNVFQIAFQKIAEGWVGDQGIGHKSNK